MAEACPRIIDDGLGFGVGFRTDGPDDHKAGQVIMNRFRDQAERSGECVIQDRKVGAGTDFGALLRGLAAFRDIQLRGMPSNRALASRATVSPTTVGAWLSGRTFPQQPDGVLRIVRAVRAEAERAGTVRVGVAAGLWDEEVWRRAYLAEAHRRADTTSAGVQAEQSRAVLERIQPGQPLNEVTDPFYLEVHHAIAAPVAGLPQLPPYVWREHDRELGEVVAQAAAGTSSLAVLVGGSSTGKTRACWEALVPLRKAGGWRVWHPIDPTRAEAALAGLPQIGPRTVVWLNEAQFYLADPVLGERVAAGLRELLRRRDLGPVLVLATLWPQHWNALTAPIKPDLHPHARELLTARRITVPDVFTGPDLDALRIQSLKDPRLDEAADRASAGQVAQYLAGVPVLLDRYETAPSATKALIHAAMDARRLGCGPRIPLALLAGAAPGYLTEDHWDQTPGDWLGLALDYVTTPCNGISGIMTAAKTGTPRNQRPSRTVANRPTTGIGVEPVYRLADYLDQHGRRHRGDEIPPVDFWTTAARNVTHFAPEDLTALGEAAWKRGLYRDAAQLYKDAAAYGDAKAALLLVQHVSTRDRFDRGPADWAVAHVPIDKSATVALLLGELQKRWAYDQVAKLLARDPAAHAPLDNPYGVAKLLAELRLASAQKQIAVLLARAPATYAPLDRPYALAELLPSLWSVGAKEQATTLAKRSAAFAPVDDQRAVVSLLRALWEEGAEDEAFMLAARVISHLPLEDPGAVTEVLEALREIGAEDQLAVLLARNPATHAALDYPSAVASLLRALREVGAEDAAFILAKRAAAGMVVDDPIETVGELLTELHELGAKDEVALLAGRAATEIPLECTWVVAEFVWVLSIISAQDQLAVLLARNPAAHVLLENTHDVADLLRRFQEIGTDDQLAVLLARNPAAHTPLNYPYSVAELLKALWKVGAEDQVAPLAAYIASNAPCDGSADHVLHALREVGQDKQAAVFGERAAACTPLDNIWIALFLEALDQAQSDVVIERLPAAGSFDEFCELVDHPERFRFGREPDGSPAAPWAWDDLD
ncbi:hypothetical protein [Actinoallomurus rhizosphaericola]|uniref:hypothetical protein n=1 Tax=Actinoallomurus rhizosphaericola TaxID=2952536 RepID=UPI0020928C74|nr:hypothetical protein [Actinoallomurus rhizosphaericola]MCO5999826.1 hypothetical protein [Actinoallomurus rhizosphaericola]